METAFQIDLARPKAPVDQDLESALGHVSSQSRVNKPPPSKNSRSIDEKWSVRGRAETTMQARLVPKSSKHSHSHSTSTHNAGVEVSELGNLDGVGRAYTLQPVDEGFGAWNYFASSFAMFIVVWGQSCRKGRKTRTTLTKRQHNSPYSRIAKFQLAWQRALLFPASLHQWVWLCQLQVYVTKYKLDSSLQLCQPISHHKILSLLTYLDCRKVSILYCLARG